jgi:peptide/nickel transport system permease protein
VIALGVLGLACLVALLAPVLAPSDPLAQTDVLRTRFLPPMTTGPDGTLYLLGTDRLGRDLMSRLIYGARISLMVGIWSVVLSLVLGVSIGMVAALMGGVIERALMGITDAALAMPRLILLLALVAVFEPSQLLVIVVLGVTGWMGIARLARAEVNGLMARSYVTAATALGIGRWRLLTRHLMPNALTPVIVAAALAVGNAITLESGLAFLGLGIPAPAPSWGNMIAGGREALVNAPWIAMFPGLAIVVTVVACNLLGDGLRDALDPETRVEARE